MTDPRLVAEALVERYPQYLARKKVPFSQVLRLVVKLIERISIPENGGGAHDASRAAATLGSPSPDKTGVSNKRTDNCGEKVIRCATKGEIQSPKRSTCRHQYLSKGSEASSVVSSVGESLSVVSSLSYQSWRDESNASENVGLNKSDRRPSDDRQCVSKMYRSEDEEDDIGSLPSLPDGGSTGHGEKNEGNNGTANEKSMLQKVGCHQPSAASCSKKQKTEKDVDQSSYGRYSDREDGGGPLPQLLAISLANQGGSQSDENDEDGDDFLALLGELDMKSDNSVSRLNGSSAMKNGVPEKQPESTDENRDLNTVSLEELDKAKLQMDIGFKAAWLRSGDEGYSYDKRIEFDTPNLESSWD